MVNCPVCDTAIEENLFLDFKYATKTYSVIRCPQCECLFYKNNFFFDFRNNFEHNRNLKTYIEKTSDIEGLITIVNNFLSGLPSEFESGLDIGCGAGMLMDFVERMLNKEMIGFEPSLYLSKEARDTFKLNIIDAYFSSSYLQDKIFDFALCLQLLQMTDHPLTLLKEIHKVFKDESVLLISTPDNSMINGNEDVLDNISILSPGVHRIVFSKKSLQKVLELAGFKHAIIYVKDGHLFALASCQPMPPINLFMADRQVVLDYYKHRLESLEKESPYFKGIWYRYYRNKIDHGDYTKALELLQKAIWFEIWSEEEIDQINTIDKFFELNSTADAIIYYYTGILFLNHLQKPEYAEKFFYLSFILSMKSIQLQPEMSVIEKDIIWLAKLHNIIAKLYKGQIEEAKNDLMSFIALDTTDNSYLPKPSKELITRAEDIIKEIA